jgi:hypothetical protein
VLGRGEEIPGPGGCLQDQPSCTLRGNGSPARGQTKRLFERYRTASTRSVQLAIRSRPGRLDNLLASNTSSMLISSTTMRYV